jgi:hypothetical protein
VERDAEREPGMDEVYMYMLFPIEVRSCTRYMLFVQISLHASWHVLSLRIRPRRPHHCIISASYAVGDSSLDVESEAFCRLASRAAQQTMHFKTLFIV